MSTPEERPLLEGDAADAESQTKPRGMSHTAASVILIAVVLLVAGAVIVSVVVVSARPAETPSDDTGTDYSALGGYCSNIKPIGASEFEARRARVATELTAAGQELFLAEPGSTMLHLANVSWDISERPFLLGIRASGEVFWVCPAFDEGTARERVGADATMLLWQEDDDLYQMVYEHVGAPASGTSVVVEPEIRAYIADGLSRAFGANNSVTIGLALVRAVRAVKSAAEIDILRCANELTKRAIQEVVRQFVTREGITEDTVHAELVKAQSAGGLSDIWSLVMFDTNAAFPHGTSNRITLRNGMMILIDTGGSLLGYQSDISRTFTFPYGQATAEQAKWWTAVHDAQMAAFEAIRVGQPCGNLDEAARAVIDATEYGSNYDTFTHRLGHGIGLQGHEEVYMVRGNTYPMTAGLCFSVEPGVYIPGRGGVRIEDIACATADGYELFGPPSMSLQDPLGLSEL